MIQHTPQSGTSELGEKLFRMQVCRAGVKASLADAGTDTGIPGTSGAAWDNPKDMPTSGGQILYGQDGICGIINLPILNDATGNINSGNGKNISTGTLDKFSANINSDDAKREVGAAMQKAIIANFTVLNDKMSKLAETLVTCSQITYADQTGNTNVDQNCNAVAAGAQAAAAVPSGMNTGNAYNAAFKNALAQGYDIPAITSAESDYDNANALAARTALSAAQAVDAYQKVADAVKARSDEEGFLTAGAYFSSVAKVGNSMRDATNVGVGVMQEAAMPGDPKISSMNNRYALANSVMEAFKEQKDNYVQAGACAYGIAI